MRVNKIRKLVEWIRLEEESCLENSRESEINDGRTTLYSEGYFSRAIECRKILVEIKKLFPESKIED